MPRAQSTKTKTTPDRSGRDAESIPEFCQSNGGISEAMYFKMKKAGEGPDEMDIGRRRVISREASARWRKRREAIAKAKAEAKAAAPNKSNKSKIHEIA
jgi:hypothetical protein